MTDIYRYRYNQSRHPVGHPVAAEKMFSCHSIAEALVLLLLLDAKNIETRCGVICADWRC